MYYIFIILQLIFILIYSIQIFTDILVLNEDLPNEDFRRFLIANLIYDSIVFIALICRLTKYCIKKVNDNFNELDFYILGIGITLYYFGVVFYYSKKFIHKNEIIQNNNFKLYLYTHLPIAFIFITIGILFLLCLLLIILIVLGKSCITHDNKVYP